MIIHLLRIIFVEYLVHSQHIDLGGAIKNFGKVDVVGLVISELAGINHNKADKSLSFHPLL